MTEHWQLPPEAAGQRFDVALATASGRSRSSLAKLFANGLITVGGNPVLSKQLASGGEKIVVAVPEIDTTLQAVPNLTILYEDDDVLAVDKPAGLVVHLSETGRPQPTVADFAATHGVEDDDIERPGIVHRLDKDTSGVLLLAKNPDAKSWLQTAFRERQVNKTYLALVRGRLQPPEATIDLPIGRNRKQPTKRAVMPGARKSVTHYKTLRQYGGYSLLEIELETGRTHQIRVHLAHLGHPVIGDDFYGGPRRPGLSRHFLHAARISLEGPNGKRVDVSSPLPSELQAVIDKLESGV